MNEYVILSDSCCDLTQQMADELNIDIVPLTVHFRKESYRNWLDEREISLDTFYSKIRGGDLPSTAAASVGDFEEIMRRNAYNEKDILCLCFSSGLSTTYQSACIAAQIIRDEFPNRVIKVIDSLTASGGHGLLVYLCAKMRNEGRPLNEVYNFAEEIKYNICGWFTVDDLFYLKRGGRISTTSAFLGTMLSIKPIIRIDEYGKLITTSKIRGRRPSLLSLIKYMESSATNFSEQSIFITHGDCLNDAKFLENEIRKRHHVKNIFVNYVGPVIGSHTGPGLVTLFFVGNKV